MSFWCCLTSCAGVVLTLSNVENPTSDFVSLSMSGQRYFNVNPQRWDNFNLTLECWLATVARLRKWFLQSSLPQSSKSDWPLAIHISPAPFLSQVLLSLRTSGNAVWSIVTRSLEVYLPRYFSFSMFLCEVLTMAYEVIEEFFCEA